MRTVAISNQKGGVGKTTTTVNLAAALTEQGKKVLLLDLDAQANATRWLGLEPDRGILDVFSDDAKLEDCIRPTAIPGIECVPASPGLANLDRALAGELGVDTILRAAVSKLPADRWDWILADCPPALGLATVNALASCRNVLIPVETKAMAVQGLAALVQTIDRVRDRLNESLSILGIVPSRVVHTRLSREIMDGLRQRFGDVMTSASIRESTRLAEAPSFKLPITTYDPKGGAAEDFRTLATELDGRAN